MLQRERAARDEAGKARERLAVLLYAGNPVAAMQLARPLAERADLEELRR